MSTKKGEALFIFLLLIQATAAVQLAHAQPEQLVVLMPTPPQYVNPYIDQFEEWYFERTGKNIEVEHIQVGGVKLVSRVEEQKGEPYEDVVTSLEYDAFERLKREGYLQPYVSPNAKYIPENVLGTLVGKDPDGYYTGFSLAAYGIMVNTEVLQNESLPTPTGYAHLSLTEDYRGHIVMGSPLTSEISHGSIDLMLAHYGWVQGWNLSIHLASLVDEFTITTGEASSLTAEGEYAAAITKNTYYNEYVEEGYSVEWVWPNEGTRIYLLYNGILKGSRHPENAKLWTDWILSEEGQQAWIECRHETVLRSDIELPPSIPTIEELSAVAKVEPNYNGTIAEKHYDIVTTIWAEKLAGYHPMLQQNFDNPEVLNGCLNDWILEPMHDAENAIAEAQDAIAEAEATSLTEKGRDLLEQAEAHVTEAQTLYNDFNHEEAYDAADEALRLALSAKGYVVPPPVWPYYLGMIIAAITAGIVSWRLGHLLFMKKYERTIKEVFKKLRDKLEVDEAGRLLLVSDVMRVPMILTTRDHIVQIQKACERILGSEKAGEVMYQSGFESGHDFATALAAMSKLKGEEILEEYLRIASVRGWGRFETVKADVSTGLFMVRVHTSIVEEFPPGKGKVCHIWRGSLAGVVQAILESLGKTGEIKSEEMKCMADGDPYCEIQITVTPTA